MRLYIRMIGNGDLAGNLHFIFVCWCFIVVGGAQVQNTLYDANIALKPIQDLAINSYSYYV